MAEFQSVDSLLNHLPANYGTTGATKDMGKDEFLKLMITQLNYQDPMNPLDATQFSSQLAEFTTVEQLANLNTLAEQGLQSDVLMSQSINNTLSATIVGKGVKALTDSVQLQDGEAGKISYDLEEEFKEVSMTIRDSSGKIVKSMTVQNPGIGQGEFEWDGRNESGVRMADDYYSVELEGQKASGNSVALPAYFMGSIEAVRYSTAGTALIVNGQEVSFGNVVEIREPEDDTGGFLTGLNFGP